jgi:cation:H+ antiporter
MSLPPTAVPLSAKSFWPVPVLMGAAFAISWAAEAAQFFMSQGLALAILAWIQGLPEFAVEAAIVLRAGRDPAHDTTLVIANLTGSLRILVGLAWPMIYSVAEFFHWRRHGTFLRAVRLEKEHAVEVVCLLPCLLYFSFIYFKDSLTLIDSGVLLAIFVAYLLVLKRIPPREMEELDDQPAPVRWIITRPRRLRIAAIAGLFIGGGAVLFFAAEPFLNTMAAMAMSLGISQFFLVQWISPLLTEFPEKLAAFNWARRIKTAPMALMNMISSNLNQWTLLPAMLPVLYAWSAGHARPIVFNPVQEVEILLTLAQSVLALLMIWKLSFYWSEAILLFALWLVQFVFPQTHEIMLWAYLIAIVLEFAFLVLRPGPRAHRVFFQLWKKTRQTAAS